MEPRYTVDLETLVSLETEVWDALARGDAQADERLLAADFLGVYSSGFADRSDHVGQLANGPTVAEFEISEGRVTSITANEAILSYRANWVRLRDGRQVEAESMYVSSLWSRRDGRWVNLFSQDTTAAQQFAD
jgi:hypothetical protein